MISADIGGVQQTRVLRLSDVQCSGLNDDRFGYDCCSRTAEFNWLFRFQPLADTQRQRSCDTRGYTRDVDHGVEWAPAGGYVAEGLYA